MSKNRRPLTDADRARISRDAQVLLAYIRDTGRPATWPGTVTVVKPRRLLEKALGWDARRLNRAEQELTATRQLKSHALTPRRPEEANQKIYRWSTR